MTRESRMSASARRRSATPGRRSRYWTTGTRHRRGRYTSGQMDGDHALGKPQLGGRFGNESIATGQTLG